ncbi:energy transducer TonB [Denitromonas ohlonensis]|uniref:Energy transducer TonB n=2 Tax=Denitromonas TaxID=139331 RepID=A0A557S620_9RHOO|nr:energy transducer TonB [Denitromonas ohlonensis]TVO72845.1 energy transducer TonB [Denitromonas ohlonensis]
MLATPQALVPATSLPRRAPVRARLGAVARLLVVLAAHAGALALGLSQIDTPVQAPITTIQVALIAPPAPEPVAPPPPAPVPEVLPPKPPTPAPELKPPPKPVVVRKPTQKPAPKPTPKPSPTAISEPKEEAPSPPESTPPPPQPAQVAAPTTPPKAAPGPVAAAPQPIIAARFDAAYLNNPSPRYPRLSRRVGEQGKVLLRVLVSESGAASDVRLHQSSGHNRLDEAARSAVSKWTFEPARQGDRPIANWVIVPIEFKLENT